MGASSCVSDTVRSMTGFGSGVQEEDGFQITAEISSVNHRYLKVTTHLPEELAWAQRTVEERVRSRFGRGAMTVVMNVERPSARQNYEIDTELLGSLYKEVESLGASIAPEERIGLRDLLGLEGVVRAKECEVLGAAHGLPVIERVLEGAMQNLSEMQETEGSFLRKELEGHLDAIASVLTEIEGLLPRAIAENRDRYRARVREFLDGTGVEIEQSDLLKEVAILAEKADITEELGRLKGHLGQFREVLAGGGRVGRKLDFLTQEMFREANTMASKANSFELTRLVVDMKADIDRVREQTQNVE